MIRIALRSLLARKLRTTLTILAILLGVAMISGTYVLTDQIDRGFKDIFDQSTQGLDVVITPHVAFQSPDYGATQSLDAAVLQQVKAAPGVQSAAGFVGVIGAPVVDGKPVATGGAPTLVYSDVPAEFSQVTFVDGAAATYQGQAAINAKLAKDKKLSIGSPIGLATNEGLKQLTVSGIFEFGNAPSLGGATIVQIPLAAAQAWFGMQGRFSAIDVKAASGTTPDALAASLRAVLPDTVDVKTAQQQAAEQTKVINDAIGGVLRPALLAFGGVSVLVGAFIIFNAFSITVSQRLREFAMLRALGASRRQVLWSVITEALVIGVAASLAGLGAGVGVAVGVNALFKATGSDIPTSGIVMLPRTVIVAMSVGVLITLLASLLPALRATRVPPVAALREGAELPPSRFHRYTPYAAGAVALLGAALVVRGMLGSGSTTQRLLAMGAGAILIFFAVAMVSRYIVRPLVRVLGWPLATVGGASGTLARQNAARNPARTAATASALMIGLAVVVFVAVFANSFQDSFIGAVDRSVQADFVISAGNANGPPQAFAAKAIASMATVPNVRLATGIATNYVQIDGESSALTAINPGYFGDVWALQWLGAGSEALFTQMGDRQAIVEEQIMLKNGLKVGDDFTAVAQDGGKATYNIIGEYRDPVVLGSYLVSDAGSRRLFPRSSVVQYTLIKLNANVDVAQVRAGLQQALAPYPTTKLQSKKEYTDMIKKSVTQLLAMLYSLLAMSVIISLFGVVNTLVLAVYERTREIGMLRAIGTTRRQMRRIVRYESVITSVIGGVMGIVIGVIFGYVVVRELGSQGVVLALPWLQLAAFLIVAGFVGVVAAVLPARRAARIDILEAIHYE